MKEIILKEKYFALQREMAAIVSAVAQDFALCGGTALSWFYLHHRMSYDLDFFASRFDRADVERVVREIAKAGFPVEKVAETVGPGRAGHIQYRFDTGFGSGLDFIKLDFVEDVHGFREVTALDGISVYTLPSIYYRKILIGCGPQVANDTTGRPVGGGRQVARDLVDLYYLSVRVEPLSRFFRRLAETRWLSEDSLERFYSWLRSFPRQEFIMECLDMDLTGPVDPKRILAHLDAEAAALLASRIESD